MALLLRVRDVELARTPCRARLPFRFGSVTVTAADLLTCRVRCEVQGGSSAQGWSADLLVPRWFRKDVARTPEQDAAALEQSATAAAAAFTHQQHRSAFALWWDAFSASVSSVPADSPDLLERGFGVALVERAVLDAACRSAGLPFPSALREDLFGFEPGVVDPALRDWDWQRSLPEPRRTIAVRHTVGMLDPLRARDLDPAERRNDGLPQALDEYVAAHGLRWFKVKVGQGLAADRARLLQLAGLFAELDLEPNLTLDGNEQFRDLGELADLLENVAMEPAGRRLLGCLRFVEQPLPRGHTFDQQRHRDLARVARFAPLCIDEADALPDSFARATGLGYRGVSVKACKGVFRALCNFGRCGAQGRFQTGEDLTNLPVLPLQQDLCLQAALGIEHVERNGHHYFGGLDHLPQPLQRAALRAHPDLYQARGRGAAVRIEAGQVRLDSVLAAPGFGQSLDGHAEGLRPHS